MRLLRPKSRRHVPAHLPHLYRVAQLTLSVLTGLPTMSCANSTDRNHTGALVPSHTYTCAGVGREERPAWSRCQGTGAERHIQEETAGLHGKSVLFLFSHTRSLPQTRNQSISPLKDAVLTIYASCTPELQGHAIKNQDLLVASGAVSLKGSEGLSAVDEDIEAAAAVCLPLVVRGPPLGHSD